MLVVLLVMVDFVLLSSLRYICTHIYLLYLIGILVNCGYCTLLTNEERIIELNCLFSLILFFICLGHYLCTESIRVYLYILRISAWKGSGLSGKQELTSIRISKWRKQGKKWDLSDTLVKHRLDSWPYFMESQNFELYMGRERGSVMSWLIPCHHAGITWPEGVWFGL